MKHTMYSPSTNDKWLSRCDTLSVFSVHALKIVSGVHHPPSRAKIRWCRTSSCAFLRSLRTQRLAVHGRRGSDLYAHRIQESPHGCGGCYCLCHQKDSCQRNPFQEGAAHLTILETPYLGGNMMALDGYAADLWVLAYSRKGQESLEASVILRGILTY
jgi:hypothetical protein